jgi:hypothetical protein
MVRKHQREVNRKRSPRDGEKSEQYPEQPRPKVPLLPKGKDPTLAERFEEELLSTSKADS